MQHSNHTIHLPPPRTSWSQIQNSPAKLVHSQYSYNYSFNSTPNSPKLSPTPKSNSTSSNVFPTACTIFKISMFHVAWNIEFATRCVDNRNINPVLVSNIYLIWLTMKYYSSRAFATPLQHEPALGAESKQNQPIKFHTKISGS